MLPSFIHNFVALAAVFLFTVFPISASAQDSGLLGGISKGLEQAEADPALQAQISREQLMSSCRAASGTSKMCTCFSYLMVKKFTPVQNEWYANILMTTLDENLDPFERDERINAHSANAVAKGLTKRAADEVRREGTVMMNFAQAHVKYGDPCRTVF